MASVNPVRHDPRSVPAGPELVATETFYDQEFGIWSSPTLTSLRRPIPPYEEQYRCYIPVRELRKMRWLLDSHPYLAFWPKSVSFFGPLFSRLDICDATLPIVTVNRLYYRLDQALIDSWQRLESALVNITYFLLGSAFPSGTPDIASMPHPSDCGYGATHNEIRFVKKCAYKSRDAFVALSTLCSFAIAMHLSPLDETAMEPGWVTRCRMKGIHSQWLQDFRMSFVCSSAPGYRAGAYVNAYVSPWARCFPAFQRANVPLIIWWGRDSRQPFKDRVLMPLYLPSAEAAMRAKHRMTARPHVDQGSSGGPVLDEPYDMHVHQGSRGSPVLDEPYDIHVDQGSSDGPVLDEPYGVPSVPGDPGASRTEVPEPHEGSHQQKGETLQMFVERLEKEAQKFEESLSEVARTGLKKIKEDAAATRDNLTAMVPEEGSVLYEWIWTPSGHQLRTLVPLPEWQARWILSTPQNRWYHSLFDEWSIVVDTAALEHDHLVEDEGILVDPSSQASQKDVQAAAEISGDIYANDVSKTYGDHIRDTHVNLRSLKDLLYYRYGFLPPKPYSMDHRMKIPSTAERCDSRVAAMSRVGLKAHKDDEVYQAVVDMYNFVMHRRLDPLAFSPLWDLEPSFLRRLQDDRHIRYRREQTIDGTLHIIGIEGTPLHKQWYLVVLRDACAVLQVFREQPTSILGIVRNLLSWGIPFNTVKALNNVPHRALKAYENIGVGRREQNHIFSVTDYVVYEAKKRDLLQGSLGRMARTSGGILWRLSQDFVIDKAVTKGPASSCKSEGVEIGRLGAYILVDDMLLERDEDIICGVYHVKSVDQPAHQSTQLSWWPKANVWKFSGMNVGYWSPDCEDWYQRRLTEIKAGTATLYSSSEWRARLKMKATHTGNFVAYTSNLADLLLRGDGSYWVE